MALKRACLLAVVLIAVLTTRLFAGRFDASTFSGINTPNDPQLLFPVTDNIDLTGQNTLQFKWYPQSPINISYFDFRLYEGYQTLESNLILKKQVDSYFNYLALDANKFEVNQVYTWVLRAVSRGGQKSEKAYSSFKIIKK